MSKFISDQEMEALEASQPVSKGFISDNDMEALESSTNPPDVSQLESLGRGGLQGGTFGFADEIIGGAEALGKAVLPESLGGDKFKDLLTNYAKYRDESRANYKAAEEANPGTFLAGEIGGSVAPAFLTGGASAVANLGKVGVQQGAKQLALAGAKQGALAGLGSSKADLTESEFGGALADTALGGAVGGVAGAVLPAIASKAGNTLKAVGETIQDKSPIVFEKGKQAYDLAKKGVGSVGKKAREQLDTDALNAADDLLKGFKSQYSKGSADVGKALNSNTSGIDFSKQLKELEGSLNKSNLLPDDLARIQKELDLYKDVVTTETVQPGLKKAVSDLQKKISKITSAEAALGQDVKFTRPEMSYGDDFIQSIKTSKNPITGEEVATAIQQDIPEDEIIKTTVEKYKTLGLEDLNNVRRSLSDTLKKGLDPKSKGVINSLKQEVTDLIEKSMDQGNKQLYTEGNEAIRDVYKAGNVLGAFGPNKQLVNDLDIGLAKKLKSSSQVDEVDRALGYLKNIDPKLKEKVTDLPIRQELQTNLKGEGGFLGGLINPKGMAIRAGEIAGGISKKSEPLVNVTKGIMNMDEAALGGFSNYLKGSNTPSITKLGGMIEKAALEPSKKDKIIWALSQQPAFREEAKKFLEEQSNQEQEN